MRGTRAFHGSRRADGGAWVFLAGFLIGTFFGSAILGWVFAHL